MYLVCMDKGEGRDSEKMKAQFFQYICKAFHYCPVV